MMQRSALAGFSLIEVLIAMLVLALGLLGLAFLQVLNVRYTNSAQHRTVATNLASEALDMMRSNPRHLVLYNRINAAYFENYQPPATGCTAVGDNVATPLQNIARWRCDVASRLPGGQGAVVVAGDEATGYTATVTVAWADDVGGADAEAQTTELEVVSTL